MFSKDKQKEIVSGEVERVGFVGYPADVSYMTLLIVGNGNIYTVFFNANDFDNNAASLTAVGDEVVFVIERNHRVHADCLENKTLAARLKKLKV